MEELFHSKNIEILRDFVELFPAELLTINDPWEWGINDHHQLVLVQKERFYRYRDRYGFLEVTFEGDGVVILRLRSVRNRKCLFRALYDSHCLDHGEKFRRVFRMMNPDCSEFDSECRKVLKEYYENCYMDDFDETQYQEVNLF